VTTRSIHDNLVYAYSVLCRRRQIVLHTEHLKGGGGTGAVEEYTDVVFDGVLAHHFENVLSGNILSSIEEVGVDHIVRNWPGVFASGRRYGMPEGVTYEDPRELPVLLARRGMKAYEISSSHGLNGWVLAETMTLRNRPSVAAEIDDDNASA